MRSSHEDLLAAETHDPCISLGRSSGATGLALFKCMTSHDISDGGHRREDTGSL